MSSYSRQINKATMEVSGGFEQRQSTDGGVINAVCSLLGGNEEEVESIVDFFEDEFLEDARQPDPGFWRYEDVRNREKPGTGVDADDFLIDDDDLGEWENEDYE